jgi:Asp-tRNA(Asn)/Glu-tRNA(Gln) amidotransferase A subunit family amidase
MSDVELTALTASQAAGLLRDGTVSSEALVSACLNRIAARDGEIHAFAHVDPEHALAQARRADAERRAGHGIGPLHGVPVALKDIISTADQPTAYGARVFAGRQTEDDAACVSALRSAGAIIIGKTVTTELATGVPAATCNPVNTAHTPGGSSSGSAAAVADGMVPVALGTQTAGSVIRPASYCGVYGYKPTFGLIPRSGVLLQSPSLDTVGVFARSIDDLALMGDVLQGHDARDPGSLDLARPALHATATMDWPVRPTFAVIKTPAWGQADPALKDAFGELLELLGAYAVELDIDTTFERALAAGRLIHTVELAASYGPLLAKYGEHLDPRIAAQVEAGRSISAVSYISALESRQQLYDTVAELFPDHGTILTPAAPGPAPAGLASTGDPVFNTVWSYLGVPAVTLPVLEANGLPIGVQLIAGRRDDGRLLRTANSLLRQLAEDSASA